ncbi:UNVERIFIED_CONTAM: hypothetical protein GTU68_067300 [Idotea baltica]|nr:hypothetical protein [Idotea baltica]
MDTISSLSSGTTNTLKSVLKLSVVIVSYSWFVDKVALTEIKTSWLVWVLSFIAIDFASYWSHRLNHSINIFWNQHIVHHSSEEFNLACALRQPISNILFMQFWYHTVHIRKLGWLEYIIVTPSQHRVHHAINDIYIDKNLAAILSIWDRIFGTFQEELDNEPCVYGVKKPVATWNPIKINWMHAWQIAKDSWRTRNWIDKFRVWFMPTGWRPEDVTIKYPVHYNKNPFEQLKYRPKSTSSLQYWSWFQYIFSTLLMIHMLTQIDKIGFPYLFVYGGFLFLLVYSYSSLMDHEKEAVWIEFGKSFIGLSIILSTGSWFYLEEFLPGGNIMMTLYFVISPIVVWYLFKQTVPVKMGELSTNR